MLGISDLLTRDLVQIDMLWDWGWTWKSLLMSTSEYGIKMGGGEVGGSLVVLDSVLYNMPTGIYITTPNGGTSSAKTTITIDNLRVQNVGTTVQHTSAGAALEGGTTTIESWILGKIYDKNTSEGRYQAGTRSAAHPTVKELMGEKGYYEREKPQYEDLDANHFMNARLAAKGRCPAAKLTLFRIFADNRKLCLRRWIYR